MEIVGIRPGEKLHEQMIGLDDAYYTFEYPEHYKILPVINEWSTSKERIKEGKKVPENFTYASNTNSDWMTKSDLIDWVNNNRSIIGEI